MGLWSDWYSKNAGKEKYSVNAEFVLKKIDEVGETKLTLTDSNESNTLPTTTANTLITTLLQTIRNNLKWLFNNTAPKNTTLTDSNESSTLPSTTSSAITTLLQTVRNNLKWLVNNKANLTGATFTGAVSAPSFTGTSSKTVKKNIKPFKKSALGIIKKVDIVSFRYKRDEDPIPQIGFIAENTDPLLSGEDRKSMRINSAIGLLLKAVQELDGKIEILEKELKEIKRKR
jgi:predicted component of type VI protein secretion system